MTLLERMQLRTNEEDTDLLEDCLETARETIMSLRFPNSPWPDEIEPRYVGLQLRMALDLYNKIGAEGQTTHQENGILRSYDSGWISKDLRQEVVPICGVTK